MAIFETIAKGARLEMFANHLENNVSLAPFSLVRAQLRIIVKRILRKHGYPPDKQEKATQTVFEQAEVLSKDRKP